MAGDWKATALKAEVWVETVKEGGRRFMATWRKTYVDVASPGEKRSNETRKVVTAHGFQDNFAKRHPFLAY